MADKEQEWQDNEEEEFYTHHEFSADRKQEPLRIDKFLLNRLEKVSRNKIQNAARAGSIQVNGQPVKQNYKVKPGDEIKIILSHPPRETALVPENIPLDIVYEDEFLVVLNKPAGLVVHPGSGNYYGTLVNGLVYHYQNLPVNEQNVPRPGLVHRLDKDTSGLMVVALEEYAMTNLAKQFFDRTIKRSYHALVWGAFEEPSGTIEGNLGRHPRHRMRMTVFPEGEEGKEAITDYKTIEDIGYVSLVECRLRTGRTHQIRVHMAHSGHPVFNDGVYGGDKIVKGTIYTKYKQFVENTFKEMPRQALHAKSLGFMHPHTGKELFFESSYPADFQSALERWRHYMRYKKIDN